MIRWFYHIYSLRPVARSLPVGDKCPYSARIQMLRLVCRWNTIRMKVMSLNPNFFSFIHQLIGMCSNSTYLFFSRQIFNHSNVGSTAYEIPLQLYKAFLVRLFLCLRVNISSYNFICWLPLANYLRHLASKWDQSLLTHPVYISKTQNFNPLERNSSSKFLKTLNFLKKEIRFLHGHEG